MNGNLEEQVQLFNFPGYLMNNECYPSVVCVGFWRNFYRLKKVDRELNSPCGEWGSKVTKVSLNSHPVPSFSSSSFLLS